MTQMASLQERYRKDIVPAMMRAFSYRNVMQVPRIEKVVLNMGLGAASGDPKILDGAVAEMTLISGQKPILTRSKKAIANFKLKKGIPIGCAVTLRREKMFDFLTRFLNVALPRVRDFKGVSPKGFDGRGNYTMGIKEQLIFPEIDYDKVERVKGMNITIVTTAKSDEEAKELLKLLGMPFRA